jgi:hypothetical protein
MKDNKKKWKNLGKVLCVLGLINLILAVILSKDIITWWSRVSAGVLFLGLIIFSVADRDDKGYYNNH